MVVVRPLEGRRFVFWVVSNKARRVAPTALWEKALGALAAAEQDILARGVLGLRFASASPHSLG
jgi:hypothetical protein